MGEMKDLYEKKNLEMSLSPGSWNYRGITMDTMEFVQKLQLKDSRLWELFCEQFAPGVDDADRGWRCEYWGKMMRGACFVYAYSQDAELYGLMTQSVHKLLARQDAEGRISSYSVEAEFDGWDMWGRKYILLGLQYYMEICRDENLKQTILLSMKKQADYILSKIGPEADGKLPITRSSNYWKGLNSSSILEPVVRLFVLTNDKKYLDFAEYIIANGGIEGDNIFERAYEGVLYPYQYPVTKAYEMMSCFEGLLEYYRVTGIEKWKTAVIHFADRIMESDITVIGCAGCTHELFDHSKKAQTDMERNQSIHMQETCVTVTWMKLCRQLLWLTGESKYADQIECSFYNAYLGTLNLQHHTSSMTRSMVLWYPDQPEKHKQDFHTVILPFDSYSPLLPNIRGKAVGGLKFMEGNTFYGCCAAIGAAGIGLIPSVSAMKISSGICMNLYEQGMVQTFTPTGNPLKITIDTTYPVDNKVRITMEPAQPEEFELRLRIPAWSATTQVLVNGKNHGAPAGSYLSLKQEWKAGLVVQIEFDFRIKSRQQDGYLTLKRGPLVLARDARMGTDIQEAVQPAYLKDGSIDGRLCNLEPDGSITGRPRNLEPDGSNDGMSCNPGPERVPCRVAVDIHQQDGSSFTVIDYASAGATWDEQSKMAAWFAVKDSVLV